MTTDLDLIRAEVEFATGDPRAIERIARELHHLRHLRHVAIARGRRLDAVTYQAARQAPPVLPLPEAPDEPGTSRDLLQMSRQPVPA